LISFREKTEVKEGARSEGGSVVGRNASRG
jgi:hypothetical protein